MKDKKEEYRSITRDLTKSLEIYTTERSDYKKLLSEFLQSVKAVFESLETGTELSTDDLANAVQLVADADEKKRYLLRQWRDLILNRMNSKSPPKLKRQLIKALLEKYFSQFLNCLEDHEMIDISDKRWLMLSSTALINDASSEYLEFLRGPVQTAIQDQMQKQSRKLGVQN